jgi:hypothetical protein
MTGRKSQWPTHCYNVGSFVFIYIIVRNYRYTVLRHWKYLPMSTPISNPLPGYDTELLFSGFWVWCLVGYVCTCFPPTNWNLHLYRMYSFVNLRNTSPCFWVQNPCVSKSVNVHGQLLYTNCCSEVHSETVPRHQHIAAWCFLWPIFDQRMDLFCGYTSTTVQQEGLGGLLWR